MGIKNGAPNIIKIIRRGLYNKQAKEYKIAVDGELMRYKGMIENNLTKHNAEEAIAATSFDYMNSLIKQIECFIGSRAKETIVFMDGTRVFNKEHRRSDFSYDSGQIRAIFKTLCYQYGLTVNELINGESELQMYLQRDKTVDLNVFLTNDSDMISICYGHTPNVQYINDDSSEDIKAITIDQTINPSAIDDNNQIYDLKKVKILDSCVWINSGKVITAIGFDFIQSRLYFNSFAYRVFISVCGTDFTSNLLTDSMITGILLSEKTDIEYINTLDDVHAIICSLLMLGLRAEGTIKRIEEKSKFALFNPDEINIATRMYLEYIETGKMNNVSIPRPLMGLACRHYLYAMREQDLCFVKKTLCQWAKSTPLSVGIDAMREYLGTYDPNMCDAKPTTPQKRKQSSNRVECNKLKKTETPITDISETYITNVYNQKTVFDEL